MDEHILLSNNKLYFLSNITEQFGLLSDLNLGMTEGKTKYITKLRISSHHLQRGRYTRPKTLKENRLCNTCRVIEDELQFCSTAPKMK